MKTSTIVCGVAGVLAIGACVSTSVIAAKVDCKSTQSGKDAYRWAWITAVVSGITAAGSLGGLFFL